MVCYPVFAVSAGLPCSTILYVVFSFLALIALVDSDVADALHSVAPDVSYDGTVLGFAYDF